MTRPKNKIPRAYRVAVFHDPKSGRWDAAIKYWSPEWREFVGEFYVEALDARDAHKKAIEQAKIHQDKQPPAPS